MMNYNKIKINSTYIHPLPTCSTRIGESGSAEVEPLKQRNKCHILILNTLSNKCETCLPQNQFTLTQRALTHALCSGAKFGPEDPKHLITGMLNYIHI